MNEKTVTNWLGLKDFFNYFLPGLIWMADLCFGLYVFSPTAFATLTESIGRLNDVVLIILMFLTPYIIGLWWGFTGNFIHRADKKFFGEPEKYVINPKEKKKFLSNHVGLALGKALREQVKLVIEPILGIDDSSVSAFSAVQYALQFIPFPNVVTHIERMTNMMNLYEGFIVPLIIGASISFVALIVHYQIWLLISFVVLIFFVYGAWFRYHYFRESRAKIIYRYFYLWVSLKDKGLSK